MSGTASERAAALGWHAPEDRPPLGPLSVTDPADVPAEERVGYLRHCLATLDCYRGELHAANWRIAALEAMLAKHQWAGADLAMQDQCPECFGYEGRGHAPNCALAALLPKP